MKRELLINEIENQDKCWDIIIIGGGSTGLGTALDAASRSFKHFYLNNTISQRLLQAEVQNWFMVEFDIYNKVISL